MPQLLRAEVTGANHDTQLSDLDSLYVVSLHPVCLLSAAEHTFVLSIQLTGPYSHLYLELCFNSHASQSRVSSPSDTIVSYSPVIPIFICYIKVRLLGK